MNLRVLILGAMMAVTYCLSAQEVVNKHTPLIVKSTATWCYPCGSWGWSLEEQIEAACEDKSVILELHDSDKDTLYNETAAAMVNQFPDPLGFPWWWVNGKSEVAVNTNDMSIDKTQTLTNIKNAVDSTCNAKVLANAVYTSTLNGNTLTVKTQTKFFNAINGTIFLGVYVIENGIVRYQNGVGKNAVHNHVLRASMTEGSEVGEQIADGSIAQNTIINNTYNMQLDPSWVKEKTYLATILWYFGGGPFYYINSYTTNLPITSKTSIDESQLNNSVKLEVSPNPVKEATNIRYTSTTKSDINIQIFDSMGILIKDIINTMNFSGTNEVNIDTNDLADGLYFCVLKSNNSSIIKKLLKIK